ARTGPRRACRPVCGRCRGSRCEASGVSRSGEVRSEHRWIPSRIMRVRGTTDSPADTGADTIAIGVFEGEGIAHDVDGGALQALVDAGEARRSFRKLAVAHAGGNRYVLVGLGERESFDPERARVAAAAVRGRARE